MTTARQPTDSSEPRVAVVVLNWNGREDTLACLESVAASEWTPSATIVVDNGSEQEIAGALAQRFTGALLVRNRENLGFAGGMNAGLARALELGADFTLLLNNDTVIDPAMLGILVEAAREHPDAGILSPLVLYRDAPGTICNAGLRFDPRRGYWGRPLGMGERDDGRLSGVREVDACSGTAMLVPSDAVREVGPLDEALYLHVEDVDWSLRMRAAGRRTYVVAGARLWHGVSRSTGGEYSPLIAYYGTRNRFVVCARHAPLRGPRAALRHAELLFTNLVHARRGRRPLANARAVLSGWRDYRRGRLGRRQDGDPASPAR